MIGWFGLMLAISIIYKVNTIVYKKKTPNSEISELGVFLFKQKSNDF